MPSADSQAARSRRISMYVDSESCIPCHQKIWETYRHSGMGRSFFRPRPENMAEDFESEKPFHHAASERYYTMYERAEKYYQRRHQIGFGGKETNVVEKGIHFVIGSGNHVRNNLTPYGPTGGPSFAR